MKLKRILRSALGAVLLATVLTGCKTPHDVAYLQDISSSQVIETMYSASSIKAEPHDQMSIVVTSKNPELAMLFNLSSYYSRTGAEGVRDERSTYTVSSKGNIDFPVLGELHVEGMTREEISGFIKGELLAKELVKDPIVTVEFLNAGISVLGEVNEPGRYDINRDQLTLLEGLALAGDIGLQGQRDNILVMRRNGDKIENYRVDLTDSKKLMNSPAYHLKQGDVIYVEPNDNRKRQTTINGNNMLSASFWVSIASLATTVAVLFVK